MVMADGNHAARHVLEELRFYGPLVAPGCHFVAEDGIVDVMNWPALQPVPLVAVQEFLAENSDFSADLTCEKFTLTHAAGGFLLRVGG